MQQTIPVVSLDDFRDPKKREEFVTTLGDALVDVGFFALENHGVDSELVGRAYAAAAEFFELPASAKGAYELPGLNGQRGYTSFGREHAKGQVAPDLKEFWHVGREIPADHPNPPRYGGNLWPSEIEGFRPVMLSLYEQLERCAMTLLEAISVYMGEEPGFLSALAHDGDTILRVIHYPPIPEGRDPASIRAAAHEDINLITLLCESTDAGLELLQRDGQWRPIHALEGQIVVDAGDMLQNLTNGWLKSTTHRVVNPDNDRARRFSMPFFVHPRGEADLSPRPGALKKTGSKRFPDITAEDYLAQRLAEIGLDS